MQGRKKQSYSEKDLSYDKKDMSVMKRKNRFGGGKVNHRPTQSSNRAPSIKQCHKQKGELLWVIKHMNKD